MDKLEDLPESWQQEIKNLRSEAANYRVKYREAVDKQEEYDKTIVEANKRFDELTAKANAATDQYEATLAAQESLSVENLRYKAAIKAGIPQYADRLKGSSLEELEADAETFSKSITTPGAVDQRDYAAGKRAPKPSGGLLGDKLAEALGTSNAD